MFEKFEFEARPCLKNKPFPCPPSSKSTKLLEKNNSAANQEDPLTLEIVSKRWRRAVTLVLSSDFGWVDFIVDSPSFSCLLSLRFSKSLWSTSFLSSVRCLILARPATSPASTARALMPPPCNAKAGVPEARSASASPNANARAKEAIDIKPQLSCKQSIIWGISFDYAFIIQYSSRVQKLCFSNKGLIQVDDTWHENCGSLQEPPFDEEAARTFTYAWRIDESSKLRLLNQRTSVPQCPESNFNGKDVS